MPAEGTYLVFALNLMSADGVVMFMIFDLSCNLNNKVPCMGKLLFAFPILLKFFKPRAYLSCEGKMNLGYVSSMRLFCAIM